MPADAVFQRQFFIELITPHLGQVITPGVKKHCGNQAFRTFYGERLARPDLFVQFQQAFFVIGRYVFAKACQNLRFFAKQIYDFLVAPDA